MTSTQLARAACSPNVEKKMQCGGLTTPLWCDWEHTAWFKVLVREWEGENQSLLHTSFCTSPVCWLVRLCSWHTGAALSCALPPSHLSWMGPKASKIKTTAWEQTCREQDMQQLPPRAAIGKANGKALLQESKRESLGSRDVLCAPSPRGGNSGSPLEKHISVSSLHVQVCLNDFRSCPLLTIVVFVFCMFHLDLDLFSFLAPTFTPR